MRAFGTDQLKDSQETPREAAVAPDAPANNTEPDAVVFTPEVIEIMSEALDASIDTLPEPVSAAHVHRLAESILHTAETGERDIAVLERIALVELQLRD
jgi:hypothetical protein